MVDIKPVKRKTVTEQIMEQIADLITSGKLKPGEQLPNERELAERFAVTRGRVREALRSLSLIGLISIRAGEGSFVNPQEEPIPADAITWMFYKERNNLDEIYAVRKLIETEIYISAAVYLTPEDLHELSGIIERLKEALPKEAALFLQLLDRFDLKVGERCGSSILAKLLQTVVSLRQETSVRLLGVPGAKETSIESRIAIMEALSTGNPKKVRKEVTAFFATSRHFYEKILKHT